MQQSLHHSHESTSNEARDLVASHEPRTLRTYTPSQAVLARSAGIYHWTPEGRRLYDFTSGVLVANLGHNPVSWMERFASNMDWPFPRPGDTPTPPAIAPAVRICDPPLNQNVPPSFFPALPMTAYNAVTSVETEAIRRLVDLLQSRPGG